MTKGAVVLLSVLFGLPTIAAAQDKALIEHGVKVYAEQKCGVCHSQAAHARVSEAGEGRP